MTPTPLTPETIARLRELEAKATKADWHADEVGDVTAGTTTIADFVPCGTDRELIAVARNALPALLDEVERHQWHRLADKQPPDGEKVLLYRPTSYGTAEVYHNVTECQYERLDNEWDHANWHGPIPAQPDDLWTRLPHPPAHLLKASNP